jgi:hypothetical protein
MSLKVQWKCDTCGRKETRAGSELPAGWRVTGGRTITHCCTDCAPREMSPGFARRLRQWCTRNPALSLMIFNFAILLFFVCVGTLFCASQFHRLHARITALEATKEGLLEMIDTLRRR